MKRSVKLLAGVAAVALSAMVSFAAEAETLRFATTLPEADNPETHAMKAFEQYVEFHTNGDIDVQLLHGGVGGDREILESVRNGIFQMTATTDGALASFYPGVQVFSTPYLFRSTRHAVEFMNNSPVMGEFVADVEKTGWPAHRRLRCRRVPQLCEQQASDQDPCRRGRPQAALHGKPCHDRADEEPRGCPDADPVPGKRHGHSSGCC